MSFKVSDDDVNFLKNYLKNKKYAYITYITVDFVEMTKNWYISLKNLNLHDQVLVVCFDELSYFWMKGNKIPSILLKANVNVDNIEEINSIIPKMWFFKYFSNNFKLDIIHTDVDIIYLKNPLETLQKSIKNFDVALCSNKEYNYSRILNKKYNNCEKEEVEPVNLFYVPYSEKSNILWDKIIEGLVYKRDVDKNNKDGFIEVLLYNQMNIKYLNIYEFANCSCFNNSLLKNKILNSCYTLHYNYRQYKHLWQKYENNENLLAVKDNKIQMMKDNNHWFI